MSPARRKRPIITGITIYPRGKKFAYNVELGDDPLTGKRLREYKGGFDTEEAAWKAAAKAKADIDAAHRVPPSKRTVAEFMTEWLTTNEESIKPSTHVNYTDYLDAYVLPTIGERRLQEVTVPVLNALYRQLLKAGRVKPDNDIRMYDYWHTQLLAGVDPKPKEIAKECGVTIYAARHAVLRYRRGRIPKPKSLGLESKTVKNIHRMLFRAFSDAVAWRYLEFNAAKHAALPRERRTGTSKRGATWTPEQLNAWLRIAVTDRDAAMWVLAATTGMRRSELAGAERARVDLDRATLAIEETRIVVDGKAEDSDGKSHSGWRTIALDKLTLVYLRAHLEMLATERTELGSGYHDDGKLMCHPDGRAIHPDTITRRFNRLVDQAGVPHIRLHDVRHTYATVSMDNGIDPKIVADRLGHASMDYTMRVYTHRSTGRDVDAAATIADVVFGDDWQPPTASTDPEPSNEDPDDPESPADQ